VSDVDEFPLHSRDAEAAISEPAGVELPRRLDRRAAIVLDFLQSFEDWMCGSGTRAIR
jgi:hypothetical protein